MSSTAHAALYSFTANIDTLQAGLGAPFVVSQQVTGTIQIGSRGADLAGANSLSVYSGVTAMTANVLSAGFTGSASPGRSVSTLPGGGAEPLPDGWGSVDGIVQTKNTANDDTFEIIIGFIDSDPRDYGGLASGSPDPVSGKTLDGLSITVRDADGILFDILGANPDPDAALELIFANLGPGGLLDDNPLDRAEVRLHFTPDQGPDQPTKITASLTGGAVVPVPAAVWLFGYGLIALIGLRRRNKLPA